MGKKKHINERIRAARRENKCKHAGELARIRKEEHMKAPNIDIDVVIPISGGMYLGHLENCLVALAKQQFQRANMGITVSCVMYEKINEAALARLCMEHEATLVFSKPRNKVFNRGFALNVGARQGSRQLIALVDADVCLHSSTLLTASRFCQSAVMAVIPVARTQFAPDHKVWTSGELENKKAWIKLADNCEYAKGGFGNAVLQRRVFEQVHGHDERFFGWGGIDTDLYYRCLKVGAVVDLGDVGVPRALHQSHPTPPSRKNDKYTRRNRELLAGSHSIVRNSERWGRVLAKKR